MAEDTDSDWDSSVLDFSTTTPRGFRLGVSHQPSRDMGAIQETAETSAGEHGYPKTDHRSSDLVQNAMADPVSTQKSNATSTQAKTKTSTLQRNNYKNSGSKDTSSSPTILAKENKLKPPFNFKGMFTADGDGDDSAPKLPGKRRKGTRYDPASEDEENLGDESDDDERILQEVRETFSRSRQAQRTVTKTEKEHIVNSRIKEMAAKKDESRVAIIGSNNEAVSPSMKKGLGSFDVFDSPLGTQKVVLNADTLKVDQSAVPTYNHLPTEHGAKRHVYRYEHGSIHYCDADDPGTSESTGVMAPLADKVERESRLALNELFGCLRLVVTFLVLLVVESVRFICVAVFTPLFTGVSGILGDALLKPMLVSTYNCCIHPWFTLLYNVGAGLKHALAPTLDITREMIGQAASLCRAFRLVEVNNVTRISGQTADLEVV